MGRPVATDVFGNCHRLQPCDENRNGINSFDLQAAAHGAPPWLADLRRFYHRRPALLPMAANHAKPRSTLSKGQKASTHEKIANERPCLAAKFRHAT